MGIGKGKQRKTSIFLAVILTTSVFVACGRSTEVAVPAIADPKVQKLLGREGLIIENTDAVTQAGTQTEIVNEEAEEAQIKEAEDTSSAISITISAAGDVTLGNYHTQDYSYSFRQMYDEVEDEAYFFQNVYDIFAEDDMTIVNLEGVFTFSENYREDQTYNIKGNPEYVNVLTAGSIEAVGMANNHRLDYGEEGSRDTVSALEQAGIAYAYDGNIGIYETQGIQIGFVSVNEVSQGAVVEKILEKGIRALKEEGVDLILACCHWGTEKENYPEDYQRNLGKKCIDWGADLVLGHHPHVLQGIEEYKGKYIVHSLANFCFGANRNPEDKDTMIFQQTFMFVDGQKQNTGEIRVIPCSVSSVANINDYCPTPARGEAARRIIDRINEYSKDFGVQFTEEGFLVE